MMIRFDRRSSLLAIFPRLETFTCAAVGKSERVKNTSSNPNMHDWNFKTKLALKPTTGKIVIIASSSVKRSQN